MAADLFEWPQRTRGLRAEFGCNGNFRAWTQSNFRNKDESSGKRAARKKKKRMHVWSCVGCGIMVVKDFPREHLNVARMYIVKS
eukprot:NODE_3573_length_541_cov_42.008130_g3031_i0.p2 GENE.NODE_3573_length_541_cov_42.008130_g3031_i0~~NODE_3573_length_541_cov_42.008130_g3031_i0.p2  ORF type:complete len:84 (+),score=17.54 NODE_3573_length_541_cov_42.008130_g3031_i0:244-495(+)